MKITSFIIAIINYSVILISSLITGSGFLESMGGLAFIFYPVYVYSLFSIFTAIYGVILGVIELKAKKTIIFNGLGVVGNVVFTIGYIIAVNKLWPALMGV